MGPSCATDCGCRGQDGQVHGNCRPDGTCACDAGWVATATGCVPECSGCDAGAGCIAPGECGCGACAYGTCHNGRCHCWAGYGGADCSTPTGVRPNSGSPMGMNVAGTPYWTTQMVWTDVMKQSSRWFTSNAPNT
jgi:hypothetical protein